MSGTSFLWLEITGRCQLECRHCYAGSSPAGTHGVMAPADWVRVLDQAADMGVEMVQFIGGEPTLHPALVDLLDHALSRGLEVEVFSNLVHITDELWEAFSRPGVSMATSYYSDDAAQHAAVTGRPSHARTRANVAEAMRREIPLRAGVIDLGGDQRAASAQAELVELGCPRWGMTGCGRSGGECATQGRVSSSSAGVAATAWPRCRQTARCGRACSAAGYRWATCWSGSWPRSWTGLWRSGSEQS